MSQPSEPIQPSPNPSPSGAVVPGVPGGVPGGASVEGLGGAAAGAEAGAADHGGRGENAGFTPEQQAYLTDLLAGLDLDAAFKGAPPAGAEPAEVTVHGTPFEDLCQQEQLKADRHPWDYYEKIHRHAAADRAPEGGDVFMFKHYGMFHVAPAQPGFMCRTRIPGCRLTGRQLAAMGELAEGLAGGYAHITTRGNLQVREIAPRDMVAVLTRLTEIGLTSKGAGADSVRNITCSPTAGFDPDELLDLVPNAVDVHQFILHTRELHGLPRKFNIAFDGGGRASCVSDTNDIAFVACRGRPEGAEPAGDGADGSAGDDLWCRIQLGGITGHGDFAGETGFAVRPSQTTAASVAMLRVFIELADRTNRRRARLKYVLDKIGTDAFCRLADEKMRAETGAGFTRLDPAACEPRGPIDRLAHIGIHPQRQAGLSYLGIAVPMGRLTPDQLRGLGELADRFGAGPDGGEARLTVWQNLVIPHVRDELVPEAVAAVEALGLTVKASSFAAGAVACTGKFGCQYASAHTKEHGLAIVDHLERRFELDSPINIHLTGCPHSCAQHVIGDVGLLGAQTEDGREAYHVFLGGGTDHEQGLAWKLCGPVAAEDVAGLLERLIAIYFAERGPVSADAAPHAGPAADKPGHESFLSFVRRLGEDGVRGRLELSVAQPA